MDEASEDDEAEDKDEEDDLDDEEVVIVVVDSSSSEKQAESDLLFMQGEVGEMVLLSMRTLEVEDLFFLMREHE